MRKCHVHLEKTQFWYTKWCRLSSRGSQRPMPNCWALQHRFFSPRILIHVISGLCASRKRAVYLMSMCHEFIYKHRCINSQLSNLSNFELRRDVFPTPWAEHSEILCMDAKTRRGARRSARLPEPVELEKNPAVSELIEVHWSLKYLKMFQTAPAVQTVC